MNRLFCVLVGLIVLAGVMPAQGSVNGVVDQNDDLRITDLPPGWAGGPFNIQIWDDNSTAADSTHDGPTLYGPKSTFCAETQQSIALPGWYNVFGLVTTNSAGRNLKGYAAWVYDVWVANESLISDDNDRIAFQNAIWAGISSGASNTAGSEYYAKNGFNISSWGFYQDLGTSNNIDIDWATFTSSGWGGDSYIGNYRFVELGAGAGNQAQMFIGSGGAGQVPEPATIIVWSLLGGLGIAIGWWRRRAA